MNAQPNPEHVTENGKLITNYSSVGGEFVENMFNEAGVSVKGLDTMTVPLKILNVLNNEEWLGYLLDHGLTEDHKDGYDFWHTLQIVEVKK